MIPTSATSTPTLRRQPTAGRRRPGGWLVAAVATMGAAGLLHVAAAVANRELGEAVVGFFLLVALAQLATAAWLAIHAATRLRPDPRPLGAALGGTVLVVLLYLVVHTTDLLAGVIEGLTPESVLADHASHGTDVSGPVALGSEPPLQLEPASPLGTAAVAVELLFITAAVALLPATWRRHAVNGVLALGALTWLLWLLGVPG